MSETRTALCIAGGWPSDRAAMNRCITQALAACGKENPSVAYVGTASGDDGPFFRNMKALLQQAGAGEVTLVPLASERADAAKAEALLRGADTVFLSGGEVDDGIRWLHLHGTDRVLRGLFDAGKPFFGLSAGSIMMGSHWVHWETEGDDSTATLFDCLGFVPTVFDTHSENEGWKELKAVLRLLGPGACGYAIPSNGAVLAGSDGSLNALERPLIPFANKGGTIRQL